MNDVTNITDKRDRNSDAKFAASVRTAIAQLCNLMNEGQRRGIRVVFSINKDPIGEYKANQLDILREI